MQLSLTANNPSYSPPCFRSKEAVLRKQGGEYDALLPASEIQVQAHHVGLQRRFKWKHAAAGGRCENAVRAELLKWKGREEGTDAMEITLPLAEHPRDG
eukprot:1175832-Prorocentrum_minimum.AAC.3